MTTWITPVEFPSDERYFPPLGVNYFCQVTAVSLGIARVRNLSKPFGRLWIFCLAISFQLRGSYVSDKSNTVGQSFIIANVEKKKKIDNGVLNSDLKVLRIQETNNDGETQLLMS